MDHDRFRDTYRQINDRACLFEKAILAGEGACSRARRFNLAEREGVHCDDASGHDRCRDLLTQLRQQVRFALGLNAARSQLPHNKALRLQVGGLRGIQQTIGGGTPLSDHATPPQITDIHGLIGQALATYGSLEQLPYREILIQIQAYRGRKRRSRD
ncbi:MAG: hypothetical protein AB2814_05710 [Candidatus Sedimenticola endophacoides]